MIDVSDNPFFALGVSTRATRSQITAAADDKTFLGVSESITEARTALIIPGKRLHAEIRWFPGMDDEKVREIAEFFRELKAGQRKGMMNTSGFRSLARLNFSVYVMSFMKFRDTSNIVRAVLTICGCFDALNIEGVCTAINNDRMIAGFPMIDEAELERAINDYRGDILAVIAGKMSGLSQDEYRIAAEKLAGEYADEGGKYYGSLLIGDFLAGYELNILPKLDEFMSKIRASASSIREFLPATVFADLLRGLEEWRKLAGPLVLSAGVTGFENANIRGQAEEIFGAVRERAVALHNERGKTSEALRLILAVKEYIDGISAGISRMISDDIRELEKLEREKRKAERERNAWEKSLYYETEFGLIFKDKFIISADGISWKGINTPLDEVSGVSWGGIRQYINGIYNRTDYSVTIYTPHKTVSLSPKEAQYNEITSHLWRALIGHLSTKILTHLQSGELLYFGDIKVKDNGVYLKKSGWFSSDVRFFEWSEMLRYGLLHYGLFMRSENGKFILQSGEYYASASYIDNANTHILEAILREFRDNCRGGTRLSSLLNT